MSGSRNDAPVCARHVGRRRSIASGTRAANPPPIGAQGSQGRIQRVATCLYADEVRICSAHRVEQRSAGTSGRFGFARGMYCVDRMTPVAAQRAADMNTDVSAVDELAPDRSARAERLDSHNPRGGRVRPISAANRLPRHPAR